MPRTGLICELTPRCNLECAFCYNVWKADDASFPAELPLDSWLAVLDAAVGETGAEWITFSGGEPLLYGELEELVRQVRRRWPALLLGLATNGVLLDERRLRILVEAGVQHVELPLFTGDEASYRAITRSDDLARARRALTQAASSPVSTTAAVTLLPDKMEDLESVLELAFALGADRIALNRFVPTGRGAAWAGHDRLSDDQLEDRLRRANAFASTKARTLDVTLPVEDCLLPHERYPNLRFHPCVCGRGKWVIDPAGRLRVCEQSNEVLGSLLSDDARELFQGEKVAAFLGGTFSDDCNGCAKWSACGGGCRFV